MNCLRQFCAASILILALTLSAFAGDINCGVAAPPPPQAAITGDINCGVTLTCQSSSTETVSLDPVTGLALSLLQSLLSVF